MVRTPRLVLIASVLAMLLLVGLVPAVAEKPNSSPAQLESLATHIVRGEVVRVFTRVRQQGKFRVTHFVAELKVAAVEKGDGIRLDRPLYARYWTQAWTGAGYPPPGTSGHDTVEEGASVRAYLARNAYDGFGTERHDGGYEVIGVNGFQVMTPAEVRAAEAEAAPKTVLAFPESWLGAWEGELTVAKPAGADAPEISKMVVVIAPTDDPARYDFRLRYGSQELRRYQLVVRDAATGQYAIDERNGVVLPATYLDGELFSYFSLGGNLLLARYRLDGDFLRFDLTSTGITPDVETGGGDVPAVGGHYVQVVQRALLRR